MLAAFKAISYAGHADASRYVDALTQVQKQIWERQADGSFRPRRIVVPYSSLLFLRFGPHINELTASAAQWR